MTLNILAAAAAAFVVGFLWYSESLFGKTWMKLSKVKPKKPELAYMVYAFIGTFFTAYVLNMFIAGSTQPYVTALLLWLGFVGTTTLGGFLWEGKPFSLWILNNAQSIVSLLVMVFVLGMF